jgi:hypothetical protein
MLSLPPVRHAASPTSRATSSVEDVALVLALSSLPKQSSPPLTSTPEAPRREDPDIQGRTRGRAQAGNRPLRRPQGLKDLQWIKEGKAATHWTRLSCTCSRTSLARSGSANAAETIRKAWDAACQAAGIAGRHRHDFRRSAVRNMVNAGVSEHEDLRAQDTRGLRPLPHREPRRPPGGGAQDGGHILGHTGPRRC